MCTLRISLQWSRSVAAFAAMVFVLASGPPAGADGNASSHPLEPQAGSWQTYVLTDGAEVLVAAPPASEPATPPLSLCTGTLGPQTVGAIIGFWDTQPAFMPWTKIQLQLIVRRGTNTPRAHRDLALENAAVFDGVVSAWFWKFFYQRTSPDGSPLPSYPSEHAVVAGAASRMLAHLFPLDAAELNCLADQAAFSRVHAGANFPNDGVAGLALGRAVADLVRDRRSLTDGSSAVWDCVTQPGRLTGHGFWTAPEVPENLCPPTGRQPTEPLAGDWATWVIPSAAAFLAEPPPDFEVYGTSLEWVCEVLQEPAFEVMDRAAATRAEGGRGPLNDLINRWAGAPGNRWNLIMLDLLVRDAPNLPRSARIAAYVNLAGADSLYASWKSKYTYWTARPVTIIRDCGFDPAFTSVRATARDPSYTSGLSTVSGAVSEVLAFFFPEDADALRAEAAGATDSRLFDGTHWRYDNENGYAAGVDIAELSIERAEADGAYEDEGDNDDDGDDDD